MPTDKELMKIARKRTKDKTAFYIHFTIYVLVNLSLLILYLSILEPGTNLIPIFFGTFFGWGIGIVAHFIAVFGGVTEEKVQKEYKKLKGIEK